MPDLTNIIPISDENLTVLKNGGSLSKDGQTYSEDANALYLNTSTNADLIADGASKKFVTNITDNGDGTITMTVGGITFTFSATVNS